MITLRKGKDQTTHEQWAHFDTAAAPPSIWNLCQPVGKICKRISLPELFLQHSCWFLQIYSPASKGEKTLSQMEQTYGYREEMTHKPPNLIEFGLGALPKVGLTDELPSLMGQLQSRLWSSSLPHCCTVDRAAGSIAHAPELQRWALQPRQL